MTDEIRLVYGENEAGELEVVAFDGVRTLAIPMAHIPNVIEGLVEGALLGVEEVDVTIDGLRMSLSEVPSVVGKLALALFRASQPVLENRFDLEDTEKDG